MVKNLRISQNEMLWWLQLPIVITRPVNQFDLKRKNKNYIILKRLVCSVLGYKYLKMTKQVSV